MTAHFVVRGHTPSVPSGHIGVYADAGEAGEGVFPLRTPLPQAMPSQRPCSSLRKKNCRAASRQAKCGLEPFLSKKKP
jgi:hypothetical protein